MDNLFLCDFLGTPPKSSKLIDLADRVLRKTFPWVRIGSYWRGMGSIESRINIFHLIQRVLAQNIDGDFVEIGCNSGESSVIIQKMVEEAGSSRKFFTFDSFEGVPQSGTKDEGVYQKGDMSTSKDLFLKNFNILGFKAAVCISRMV